MFETYKLLISSPPSEVKFADVVDIKRLAERIAAVSVLIPNLIEIEDGFIEFCPEVEPAIMEELILWTWAFRPDLSPLMLKHTLPDEIRLLIDSYHFDEMKYWWDRVNNR